MVSLPSEDGGQLPLHHYDGGPDGGGEAGSQDSTQYSYIPNPGLTDGQGGRGTPAVTVTCQTREGTDAHSSQVGVPHHFQVKTGIF